jgi:ribosomal protein L11
MKTQPPTTTLLNSEMKTQPPTTALLNSEMKTQPPTTALLNSEMKTQPSNNTANHRRPVQPTTWQESATLT